MEIIHEGFRYEAIGNDLVLKGCDSSNMPDLQRPQHIPSMIDGKTVVGIGYRAFYGLYMSTISFPATISNVAEKAFAESDIECVRFVRNHAISGSKTLTLGEKAFENCRNLRTFDSMQDVSVGYMAFSGCNNLDTNNMGIGVSCLQQDAFAACQKVKSLYVADGGVLKTNSIRYSNIKEIHIVDKATFEEGVLDEILENEVTIFAMIGSPILDVAYLGIKTVEEMPF